MMWVKVNKDQSRKSSKQISRPSLISGRATDSIRGSGRIPRKSYAEVLMNLGGKYPVVKGGKIGQDCLGCCHGKDVGMVTEGTLQQEEDEADFEELSRASREVRKSADFLEEVIVPQVNKPTDEIPVIEESP
ncbi:hypothetical protein Dimus_036437 [Dionaea muscipula]